MNMQREYQPVSCAFLDNVEVSAIKGRIDDIKYYEGNEIKEIEDSVEDWRTENGEEFLITGNGRKIRMDRIIQLFEHKGPAYQDKPML